MRQSGMALPSWIFWNGISMPVWMGLGREHWGLARDPITRPSIRLSLFQTFRVPLHHLPHPSIIHPSSNPAYLDDGRREDIRHFILLPPILASMTWFASSQIKPALACIIDSTGTRSRRAGAIPARRLQERFAHQTDYGQTEADEPHPAGARVPPPLHSC